MGWHINYEVVFEGEIDWDDDNIQKEFDDIMASFFYLRGAPDSRVMLQIYTTYCTLDEAMKILDKAYDVPMKYRVYGTEVWKEWSPEASE